MMAAQVLPIWLITTVFARAFLLLAMAVILLFAAEIYIICVNPYYRVVHCLG
jgi:hypothetical protein